MKKFKEGEIFINTVKAYPRSEFKCNSGVVTFNRQNYEANTSLIPIEAVSINNFINRTVAQAAYDILDESDYITTEGEDFLISEDNFEIVTES